MFKPVPAGFIKVAVEPDQLIIGDESRFTFLGELGNMPTRVGPVRTFASELGEVQHFSQRSQHSIGSSRGRFHRSHQFDNVDAFKLGHLD